jgi:outer membrane receptor protein involved in Fe transport
MRRCAPSWLAFRLSPDRARMKSVSISFLVLFSATIGLADSSSTAEPPPEDNAPPAANAKAVLLDRFVVNGELDRAREDIAPSLGASAFKIDRQQIEIQPLGGAAAFNQVILRVPGAAQDSFGQLHLRGEHANLQYRLNDVLLPEGLSGFGSELDTRFIESANVLTGTLPAQFGYRTAGVVDLHTKSGAFLDGATASLNTGSHDTFQPSLELGGTRGATNGYLSASYDSNSLGIENPTGSNSAIHDRTRQSKLFGYASTVLDSTSRLSLIASTTDSHFQIPNNPGQVPAYTLQGATVPASADLDERQDETNAFFIAAYQKSAGTWDAQVAAYVRESGVDFHPDPIGDLIYNGVASATRRRIRGEGLEADLRWTAGPTHNLRAGLLLTGQTATTTTDTAVFPVDASGGQTSDIPLHLAPQGRLVSKMAGFYLQDEWKAGDRLTLNYGVRADSSRAARNEGQLSPRLNAVFQAGPDTTWHAGYARYFTPPPLELVPESDLARFAGTTNASAVTQDSTVRSERAHYFDLGLTHQLSKTLSFTLDSYLKSARDQLDEGQFGQALIFSPFNYDRGRVSGVELSGNYTAGGFSAYANLALSRATARRIVSGEFQFDPDELAYIATHDVHLDHDQQLTASLGASYRWGHWETYADLLYGSGLRRGFANTGKLPAYAPLNVGLIRKFKLAGHRQLTVRVDAVNALDAVYALRDGSGIGVGAPQYGPRRGFFGGLTWAL